MTTAATPAPAPATPMCLWIIGWGGNDPARRNVGGTETGEFWPMQAAKMRRAGELGYPRRHCVSNPHGCLAGEDMQLDQGIHAENAGLSWLTRPMAGALRPITGEMEVLAYYGTQSNDADFLKPRRGRWGADDYKRRLERSLRPANDAGCSICWDASFATGEGSVEYRTAMLEDALAREGGKGLPYTRRADWHEPPACLGFEHWWDKPGIITEQLYRARVMEGQPGAWHPAFARITGEYVRSMNVTPERYITRDGAGEVVRMDWSRAAGFIPDFVRECWGLGQTPMVDFSWFVARGVTFAELMEGTDLAVAT